MPKIVMVKKKDVFLGERVRAGVEPALCVKKSEAHLHARCTCAIHPADDTQKQGELWCNLAPMWNYERRTHLSACAR